MKVYIRSAGNISPQHSLDRDAFFSRRVTTCHNFLKSMEPDYGDYVDSKMIRRMSRIVKMGVAAAMTCLQNEANEPPAAILTATAYGCLEDTSSFLRRMIEFDEKMLSPTAFIQSTHNTVGAQIALLLKCHNYNNTIVHRSFSFENAITESILLIQEGMEPTLVGAVDEITDDRHTILSRFGLYKQEAGSGRIAGEGAAFFLIGKEPGPAPLAILQDMRILYKPDNDTQIKNSVLAFLRHNNLSAQDIDLLLTGDSGNLKEDEPYQQLMNSIFATTAKFPFKSLCGSYPTASGFAVWMASVLLNEQKQPTWMTGLKFPLKNILIHQYNDSFHHSFFILSAC
jgi:3-oxoacyl-[acyl-carrier-protein] synthase II